MRMRMIEGLGAVCLHRALLAVCSAGFERPGRTRGANDNDDLPLGRSSKLVGKQPRRHDHFRLQHLVGTKAYHVGRCLYFTRLNHHAGLPERVNDTVMDACVVSIDEVRIEMAWETR